MGDPQSKPVPKSVKVRFDVFISYCHAADRATAKHLRGALQQLAKPWYRLRAMRVFRDDDNLAASPEGWSTIEAALEESGFLLLMASPGAAGSASVAREIGFWLKNGGSAERLLIALMDGDIRWDDGEGDFDWKRTTALPRCLAGACQREPFWEDLRWTHKHQVLTLRNPEFSKAVAKLASPVRDLDYEVLVSEDHRQHRRTRRVAVGTLVLLVALLTVAVWQFRSRLASADRERDQTVLAFVAHAYRTLYVDPLQALDHARSALAVKTTPEGQEILRLAQEVAEQRRETRRDERSVLGSGDGYMMERWRQGDTYARLRNDGRIALVASERGADGPDPPGDVYLVRLDDMRTRLLEPGENAARRRLEYMGFSSSGEEIFVARQFYLDIYDLGGNLTKSVQLEYHAKPTHLIAGMFASFVLVGDTVGHVMLADTASSDRPQLKGSRHADAAVSIEVDAGKTSAIVVFESGRADLIELQELSAPREHELTKVGTIHAAFCAAPHAERFLTASSTGAVDVWQIADDGVTRLVTFEHEESPVGLASFSSDGARIISLTDGDVFRVWDIGEDSLLAEYRVAR